MVIGRMSSNACLAIKVLLTKEKELLMTSSAKALCFFESWNGPRTHSASYHIWLGHAPNNGTDKLITSPDTTGGRHYTKGMNVQTKNGWLQCCKRAVYYRYTLLQKNALSALLGGVVIIKAQKKNLSFFIWQKKIDECKRFYYTEVTWTTRPNWVGVLWNQTIGDVTQCDHKATPVTSESAIFHCRVYI